MSYKYQRIFKSDKTVAIKYNGDALVISDFSFDRYDYYGDSPDSYFQIYVKAGNYSGFGRIYIDYHSYESFVNDMRQMNQIKISEARIVSIYEVEDALLFSLNNLGQLNIYGSISDDRCRLEFRISADQTVLNSFCRQLDNWLAEIQRKNKRKIR